MNIFADWNVDDYSKTYAANEKWFCRKTLCAPNELCTYKESVRVEEPRIFFALLVSSSKYA